MNKEFRFLIYNVLALICGVWFLLVGWYWGHLFNVIFVFPIAILGFFLWRKGQGAEKKLLNKIVGWLLWAGCVSSIGFLIAISLK